MYSSEKNSVIIRNNLSILRPLHLRTRLTFSRFLRNLAFQIRESIGRWWSTCARAWASAWRDCGIVPRIKFIVLRDKDPPRKLSGDSPVVITASSGLTLGTLRTALRSAASCLPDWICVFYLCVGSWLPIKFRGISLHSSGTWSPNRQRFPRRSDERRFRSCLEWVGSKTRKLSLNQALLNSIKILLHTAAQPQCSLLRARF